MVEASLSNWLDKLRGKNKGIIDTRVIEKKIKELQKERRQHKPGSKKHLEIQSKINELNSLKSN